MKMTTEEAFVKVLQMHGIEHAFGIIGSAMMPISDLFPAAGIKFWDCAHEVNAGMSADGYTRATGKMSMAIAQNGPGITNMVTPIITAYWKPHASAPGDAAGRQQDHRPGRVPGDQTDGNVRGLRLLPGGGSRSHAHRRGPQPGHLEGSPRLSAGADQRPARFLDPGCRHRPAAGRTDRASPWQRDRHQGGGQGCSRRPSSRSS